MDTREAAIAARRFGLGPKSGDLKRIAADPRGYVLAALARKDAAVLDGPGLEASHVNLVRMREARQAQQLSRALEKQRADKEPSASEGMSAGAPVMTPDMQGAAGARARPGELRREVMLE